MLNGTSSINIKDIKNINKRKYTWSFIGNIKQYRLEIIDKFSNKFNEKFVGNNITPSEMLNIYNNSIMEKIKILISKINLNNTNLNGSKNSLDCLTIQDVYEIAEPKIKEMCFEYNMTNFLPIHYYHIINIFTNI